MRVLIFGKSESIWVKTVVEHTLLKYGDEVTILSAGEGDYNPYLDFYKQNNVTVYPYRKRNGKLGTLLSGFTNLDVLKKKYDLFCVHYVNNRALCVFPIARLYSKRSCLFFWGSDLLRDGKRSFLRSYSYKNADHIGISTQEMLDRFHSLHGYSYDKKIIRTHFGVNGLDPIKDINCDMSIIRHKYNIDPNKVVISIGYNNIPEQQHIKVLNQIINLPENARDKIHLLVRMTYGMGSKEYIAEVKDLIIKTGCSYSVFDSFLSDIEIAELTKLTDIFIHAQTTDARSASMLEHLYANCLVINPAWINYADISDSVFYLTFDALEDLKKIITNNLDLKGNNKYLNKLLMNTQAVAEFNLWDKLAPTWRDAYN